MKKFLSLALVLSVGCGTLTFATRDVQEKKAVTSVEIKCPICGGQKPKPKSETVAPVEADDATAKCGCGKPPRTQRDVLDADISSGTEDITDTSASVDGDNDDQSVDASFDEDAEDTEEQS